jgi:hypothetical protein
MNLLARRSISEIILISAILLIGLMGKAQPNISLFPFDGHFNSSGFNPAFLNSSEKFTFSMIPFGGISIGYNNQEVIKDLVSGTLQGITSDEDYKKVLKSITDRTSFNQNIESILLTFTFRSSLGFFNFQIKENQSFSVAAKGELTSFVFNTNIQSATINRIQNLPAQAMHYREYSLGYSLPSRNRKFTAGIRPKIYYGKAAFFSGLSGSIQRDSSDYILKAGGKVKLSMPMTQTYSDGKYVSTLSLSGKNTMNYIMNRGNPGFGIDLGFNYSITPDLALSMSVLDLGKIEWKSSLNSKVFDGAYPISSQKIIPNITGDVITKSFSNSSFADSISNIFDQSIDSTEFSSSMPVKIYAGIKHQISPRLNISLIDRYVYLKNMNYNSISFMVGYDINKELSVSTGYCVISNSYANLPLAFLYKMDIGQMYIGTDNLLSFIIPSASDFAGISFGTCFYLFKNSGSSSSISGDYPFYKPKKPRRNPKTGLIWKEYPNL